MMTSTELKIGLTNSSRPSSRVLKPPGGGHSNIFAGPEVAVNAPRPKYNQQNSSNLNACIGSTDPNQAVEKLREEIIQSKQTDETPLPRAAAGGGGEAGVTKHGGATNTINNNNTDINGGGAKDTTTGRNSGRGPVPPGGYSSGGFW